MSVEELESIMKLMRTYNVQTLVIPEKLQIFLGPLSVPQKREMPSSQPADTAKVLFGLK